MQWDASPGGGFTTGEPWLPLTDPAQRNVADQRDDAASMLSLVRELIALRRELGDQFELLEAAEGIVAFRRGRHTVAINTTSEPLPVPFHGEPRIQTRAGALQDRMLAPHAGVVGVD
jgi:alpha-glucosidase